MWREVRLREALDAIAGVDRATYDRVVTFDGRPGHETFMQIVRAVRVQFQLPSDQRTLSNKSFRKPDIHGVALSERNVERAFTALNAVLASEHVPLRLRRTRVGVDVADAPEAWAPRLTDTIRDRLVPETLPHVIRSFITQRLQPFILQRDTSDRQIALVAPAGFGKTTALGQIASMAASAGIAWCRVAFCQEHSAERPPGDFIASQILGCDAQLAELCEEIHARPGGLVLIDTVDIVLAGDVAPEWASTFARLAVAGALVIVSCRDWEWRHILAPHSPTTFPCHVPPFSAAEVREAVDGFCALHGVNASVFGSAVAELMTEERRLERIVRNPLLLALVCQLFGPSGTVPKDLTVLRLYEELVERRVRRTRRNDSPDHRIARGKERICWTFTREAIARSTLHVQEILTRDLLGDVDPDAFAELRSDGIIEDLPGLRLRFFHQTFLEFMAGCWLTTEPAHAEDFLAHLKMADVPFSTAALLRSYLSLLPDPSQRLEIVRNLPLDQLPVFQAAALAWAAHGSPVAILDELVARGAESSTGFQLALADALEVAPKESWRESLRTLLQIAKSFDPGVVRILAGVFAEATAVASAAWVDEVLGLLRHRSIPEADLLSTYVAELSRRREAEWAVRALQRCATILGALGKSTRDAVVLVMASDGIDPEVRSEFFSALLQLPADSALESATVLTEAIWRNRARWNVGGERDAWLSLLHDRLPNGWHTCGYRALGRWLAQTRDSDALAYLANRILGGPKSDIAPIWTVLSESMRHGVPPVEILRSFPDDPTLDRERIRERLAILASEEVSSVHSVGNDARRDSPRGLGETPPASPSIGDSAMLDQLLPDAIASLSYDKKRALSAARRMVSALSRAARPINLALVDGLFASPIPGVRAVAFRFLADYANTPGAGDAEDAQLMGILRRVCLDETSASSFAMGCEALRALLSRLPPPHDGPAIVRDLIRWLETAESADGGSVLRVARILETLVPRAPAGSRGDYWAVLRPSFVRLDWGRRNVEKHIVPVLRYMVRDVHDAIAADLDPVIDRIPHANRRALYLALLREIPASEFGLALRRSDPLLAELRPRHF